MKRPQFDSSQLNRRAEELVAASSNRYRITVQVANRAKRYRYEDFDSMDDQPMKPVIRAIFDMSDELTSPEIIGEVIEPPFEEISPTPAPRPAPTPTPAPRPAPTPAPTPAPSSPTNTTSSPRPSEQILQINTQVNANPQLRQLRQESNSNAWNSLVNWIGGSICEINFAASESSVKRLKHSCRDKSPYEIAHVLIVHKSLQAAGVDLVRGIPRAEAVIRGIAKYDLPEITKLSAEMVYQIADIYGFNLQDPERKIEALTAFGAAFLGERAIDAGIDWLKYGMIPSKIISASAKALMIYAVGNAACKFYETKLNQHINPLTSPTVINKIREQSQHYLDNATSEEGILALISSEINTALTIDYTRLSSLLKVGEWKKADQETCDIIVKIANRDFEGNLRILPRDDLHTINQLWSQNSNGHFGFKAQKQIYSDVSKKVGDFGEKIGWRGKAGLFGGVFGWKSYDDLNFNLKYAPKGHLPAFPLNISWWYHSGEATRDFAQSILERNDW